MPASIEDGAALFGCPVEGWWSHPRLSGPQGPARRLGPMPPLSQVNDAPPLAARIYEGAWIVDCPCGGADYVWIETPLTICGSCGNRASGGGWRRVLLPENRAAIERQLLARAEPWQRNWIPGETVGDLVRENAQVLP